MSQVLRLCALAGIVLGACIPAFASPGGGPTQFVIISFDGAHDLAQWKRSRALAKSTGARFTYFLSCVFVLTKQDRGLYHPPEHGAGRSNVGFAQSKGEVAERLDQIWKAHRDGHEIASHGCGHFDGGKWRSADWQREFDAFDGILRNAFSNNGIEGEPGGWRDFVASAIRGFRAPYLSTNPALYDALAARGFTYDASGVSRGPVRPDMRRGLTRFSLPLIPEGPRQRRVIAMDYNLFVRHSDGTETKDAGAVFETRAFEAFRAAFDLQYEGKRIPLQVGFHFSLMNDGAYWRALERFVRDVCNRPAVACVSYADYLRRTERDETDSGIGG